MLSLKSTSKANCHNSEAGQKEEQRGFVFLIKTGFIIEVIMVHIKQQLRKQDVTAGFAQNMS